MKDLSSDVPEALRFVQKHQDPSRGCVEGCAVIDPANSCRILASRGSELAEGEDFFAICGVSEDDRRILDRLSPTHERILAPCQRGSVLLFADLFWDTGLLIGVLLPFEAASVLRGLHWLGQQKSLLCAESLSNTSLALQMGDETICRHLEELFYYLTRMLVPKPEASLWTRCLLIANFAGCRLHRVALPVEAPRLSKRDESCMTLFLLCSFLTLRRRNGKVTALGDEKLDDNPRHYHCTVLMTEDRDGEEDEEDEQEEREEGLPCFLSASCFSGLAASFADGQMSLRADFSLPSEKTRLFSLGDSSRICLSFLVQCA